MAPQIVEDVIEWLFGKRRRKNTFYGGRSNWMVPGYGSNRSGRSRPNGRSLPENDAKPEIGSRPVGQTSKVIDFDDGSSVSDNYVEDKFTDIDNERLIYKENIDQESQDTESESSLANDLEFAQGFSNSYDKSLNDDNAYDQELSGDIELSDIAHELTDINYDSSVTEKTVETQVSDMQDKYYIDEVTGIRVLRFEDSESPVNNEETTLTKFETTSNVASAHQIEPGIHGHKNSNELVVTESSSIELYEEGSMSNTHYIAHNENESNLVQRMHPECRVMIPDDYDGAIEEIMTCPLDCPYKVLELAEVDQKTLRSRLLK